MKRKYLVLLIVVAISLISVTGLSYAYFVVKLNSDSDIVEVVQSGTMNIYFNDGSMIGTPTNMLPGDSVSMTFRVENFGSLDTKYSIYLYVYENTFVTKSDLVYTLTSDDGVNISETVVPSSDSSIALDIPISTGNIHYYELTLTFKDTGENQNDNQGAIFSGRIYLAERDSSEVINLKHKINLLSLEGSNDLITNSIYNNNTQVTDNNIRYVGANPSNYVYFNCSTTDPVLMNDSTCEKWRIIGLMDNIRDSVYSGAISMPRVKIVRDESLGNYSFDYGSGTDGGNHTWSVNEQGNQYLSADLMKELNYDYLGNIIVGTDGKWYGFQGKNVDMPTNSLNIDAINMIQRVDWNTSADNSARMSTSYIVRAMYNWERSNYTGAANYLYNEDKTGSQTHWLGMVGLIYPSDYGYSTSGGSTMSRTECYDVSMYYWSNPENQDCRDNSWLYKRDTMYWTITPAKDVLYMDDPSDSYVFYVYNGSVSKIKADTHYVDVYPSVYLKDSVNIYGGNGTSSNPYKLVLQN